MRTFIFTFICFLIVSIGKAEEARLIRFPHINGKQIVFSYAGDLYTVSDQGGTARKLTSDIGYEMFPRISPDGKYIAFTGQYDGNTEVFVIPSAGGIPRRLTYTATLNRDDLGDRMGPNNIVIGWTPDSKHILFRTRQFTFNDFTGQLMTVPAEGGEAVEIPLKNGGFASYSPDGKKLAYNYVFREFRTWKRYQGGMADDIRIYHFDTHQSQKITDEIRQDIIPMWSADGNKIYFISDRDDIMNLYVYNLSDKTTRQLTFNKDYDIKFPALGGDQIVYEQGGILYKFKAMTFFDLFFAAGADLAVLLVILLDLLDLPVVRLRLCDGFLALEAKFVAHRSVLCLAVFRLRVLARAELAAAGADGLLCAVRTGDGLPLVRDVHRTVEHGHAERVFLIGAADVALIGQRIAQHQHVAVLQFVISKTRSRIIGSAAD